MRGKNLWADYLPKKLGKIIKKVDLKLVDFY